MDVAILCPGPSLRGYLAAPVKHDLTIGVNGAVLGAECDWWLGVDANPFRWWTPLGKPKRCTSWTAHQSLTEERLLGDAEWLLCENIPTDCKREPPWTNYSLTAAMVLADHLGADRIFIYGCDWKGSEYFFGEGPFPADIGVDRWGNEQWIFGHVEGWLRSHGVEVVRVQPESYPSAPAQITGAAEKDRGPLSQKGMVRSVKRYEVKAKRPMRCGERELQPGDTVCRIEYEDDVPAEFFPHAFGSDLVMCEARKDNVGPVADAETGQGD